MSCNYKNQTYNSTCGHHSKCNSTYPIKTKVLACTGGADESHIFFCERDWESIMDGTRIEECCAQTIGNVAFNCKNDYCATSDTCAITMNNKCMTDFNGNCQTYVKNTNVPYNNRRKVLQSVVDWHLKTYRFDKNKDQLNLYVDLCSKLPGACDIPLKKYCKIFTKEQLSKQPQNIQDLCGCFLSEKQYILPGILSVACNPICSLPNSVKRGIESGSEYKKDTCTETLCVINDVNIDNLGKIDKIKFNELCNKCKGSTGCVCVIGDINIESNKSKIKDIDFHQNCKGGCINYNEKQPGLSTKTTCGTGSILDKIDIDIKTIFDNNKILILSIIITIIILILFVILFNKKKK